MAKEFEFNSKIVYLIDDDEIEVVGETADKLPSTPDLPDSPQLDDGLNGYTAVYCKDENFDEFDHCIFSCCTNGGPDPDAGAPEFETCKTCFSEHETNKCYVPSTPERTCWKCKKSATVCDGCCWPTPSSDVEFSNSEEELIKEDEALIEEWEADHETYMAMEGAGIHHVPLIPLQGRTAVDHRTEWIDDMPKPSFDWEPTFERFVAKLKEEDPLMSEDKEVETWDILTSLSECVDILNDRHLPGFVRHVRNFIEKPPARKRLRFD